MAGDPFAQASILFLKALNPLSRQRDSALAQAKLVQQEVRRIFETPLDARRINLFLLGTRTRAESAYQEAVTLTRSRGQLSGPFKRLREHLEALKHAAPRDMIERAFAPGVEDCAGERRFAQMSARIASAAAQLDSVRIAVNEAIYLFNNLLGTLRRIDLTVKEDAERVRRRSDALASFAAGIQIDSAVLALETAAEGLEKELALFETQRAWERRLQNAERRYRGSGKEDVA